MIGDRYEADSWDAFKVVPQNLKEVHENFKETLRGSASVGVFERMSPQYCSPTIPTFRKVGGQAPDVIPCFIQIAPSWRNPTRRARQTGARSFHFQGKETMAVAHRFPHHCSSAHPLR
jgi:hypothetical protein